jgi:hypothetical protein
MDAPVSVCPVPLEQQPINEYKDLQESCLFRRATLNLRSYLSAIAIIWWVSWLVAGPVAAGSFPPMKSPAQFLLSAAAGASLLLALVVLRLYLGWSYVRDRLLSEKVFYEESGWYDGQYWSKPAEVIARDRLIVSYEIEPILRRLKRTFGFLGLFFLSGSLIWFCL